MPILNNEQGALYVDALILEPSDIDAIFGFSRAYFMVETQVPSAIIQFLMDILPGKGKADLYSAIGFHKQGKTAFYRDFLHHLSHSSDKFIGSSWNARNGDDGNSRCLPIAMFSKSSRTHLKPPKKLSRSTVIEKYRLVKQHDRVGRLADTLEYSEVALPRNRFSAELL